MIVPDLDSNEGGECDNGGGESGGSNVVVVTVPTLPLVVVEPSRVKSFNSEDVFLELVEVLELPKSTMASPPPVASNGFSHNRLFVIIWEPNKLC